MNKITKKCGEKNKENGFKERRNKKSRLEELYFSVCSTECEAKNEVSKVQNAFARIHSFLHVNIIID